MMNKTTDISPRGTHVRSRLRQALLLWAVLLLTLCLAACSGKPAPKADENKPLRVVAAIFPAYDWTRNVLGENPAEIELSLLLDNGVDLHSYQPSVDDILTISGADLFIYTGGESDRWVSDALKQANNPELHIVKMLEALGDAAKTEETVEGMQAEGADGEDKEEAEYDEHVWLSLRNAAVITDAIAAGLTALDGENAETYQKNAAVYTEKLRQLDDAYAQAVADAPIRTILFGDRFPFRYLTDDYGLDYYAAFQGCSAETEASFETITFLARKCDELDLPAVLTIDGTDHRIAETIVQNTQSKAQKILTLDSMQSVSAKEIENGTDYLSVMESDLAVLKAALGEEMP